MRKLTILFMLSLILVFSGCELEGEDGFPPQLTVISPTTGETVAGAVCFVTEAVDNIGIDRVELLVDGTVHFTADTSPWQCRWQTFEYESGLEYEVIIRAWDHAGNYDRSDPLLLTLDNSGIDPHQAWLLPPRYRAEHETFTIYWKASRDLDFASYTLYESGEPDMRWGHQIHTATVREDTVFTVGYEGRNRYYQLEVTDSDGLATRSNIQKADPDIRFVRTYNIFDAGELCSIEQIFDGGYIMAGAGYAGPWGGSWLLKTDAAGNELWRWLSDYYAPPSFFGVVVRQTLDGGFILLGDCLRKTDECGELIWVNEAVSGCSIDLTDDGGYIVLQQINWYGSYNLIKCNGQGAIQWTSELNSSDPGYLRFIRQTSDRGYVILGSLTSGEEENRDILLVKTDTEGDLEWVQSYNAGADERGYCVIQTVEGGFTVAGQKDISYSSGEALLLKVDADGNLLWHRTYNNLAGSNGFRSLSHTQDGCWFLTGYTDGVAWWMKVSTSGDPVWEMTHTGYTHSAGSSGQQTAEGGFVIGGTAYQQGEMPILIKTDADGIVN